MPRVLMTALVLTLCAPAFAVDKYTVAEIKCPAGVYAALNWVDTITYDAKFRVENGIHRIEFEPFAIEWNGQGKTPQTIFCRYRQTNAPSEFQGRYIHKTDGTSNCVREYGAHLGLAWNCYGHRITCPMATHTDLNWVDTAGSDPKFHVETGVHSIDFQPVSTDRNGPTFFCTYTLKNAPPDIQATYSYKVHRHIIECTKSNNITLSCKVKP